jgi:transcription elongation factor GreB
MSDWISQTGYDKLKAEWDELYKQIRPKLLEEIAAAAAQGDRSENAEYIYGRKKLREIDKRLREIGNTLHRCKVVEGVSRRSDKIYFGAKVALKKADGKSMTVQLVGPDEIDPTAGLISVESPMGKALMGHAPTGDIEVDTPRGRLSFSIVSVEYD